VKRLRELALADLEREVAVDEVARVGVDAEIEYRIDAHEDGQDGRCRQNNHRVTVDGGDQSPARALH